MLDMITVDKSDLDIRGMLNLMTAVERSSESALDTRSMQPSIHSDPTGRVDLYCL